LKADGLLIRSAGFLQQLLELGGPNTYLPMSNSTIPILYGDFSLNAANALSAKLFLGTGLNRLAPTHDLNVNQISELVQKLGKENGEKIECIIHQHLPIFYTEHWVFCRFLSNGNNFRDCGHPCENNNVDLRDMNGQDHIVLADMGCRNTVFNAKAQSGAQYLNILLDAGVKYFRIELVDEDADYVEPLLSKYREIILSNNIFNREKMVGNLLEWLSSLPNRNGIAQGVNAGSLEPINERDRTTLKPTARG
jgi:collagenase-like PrtC family protease